MPNSYSLASFSTLKTWIFDTFLETIISFGAFILHFHIHRYILLGSFPIFVLFALTALNKSLNNILIENKSNKIGLFSILLGVEDTIFDSEIFNFILFPSLPILILLDFFESFLSGYFFQVVVFLLILT